MNAEKSLAIFLFYLLGCLLSYARLYASAKGVDYKYEDSFPEPLIEDGEDLFCVIIITLLSWLGVAGGIYKYIKYKEYYFLKLSDKDLRDRYYHYWNINN